MTDELVRDGTEPTGSATTHGAPAESDQNSLSLSPNGPLLLHDVHLVDTLAHFNRENVPERRPHAKGSGAFGQFETTEDVSGFSPDKMHRQQLGRTRVRHRPRGSIETRGGIDIMSNTDTDERIIAIEREMRQEDPTLVAAFERLGSFESDDESGQRLLLLASAVVIATAIATMSPVAWVLGAVGLYAWRRS